MQLEEARLSKKKMVVQRGSLRCRDRAKADMTGLTSSERAKGAIMTSLPSSPFVALPMAAKPEGVGADAGNDYMQIASRAR